MGGGGTQTRDFNKGFTTGVFTKYFKSFIQELVEGLGSYSYSLPRLFSYSVAWVQFSLVCPGSKALLIPSIKNKHWETDNISRKSEKKSEHPRNSQTFFKLPYVSHMFSEFYQRFALHFLSFPHAFPYALLVFHKLSQFSLRFLSFPSCFLPASSTLYVDGTDAPSGAGSQHAVSGGKKRCLKTIPGEQKLPKTAKSRKNQ